MKDINLNDRNFTQDERETLITALSPAESKEHHRILEDYWLTQLAGELPVLDFPRYNNRQLSAKYKSATVNYIYAEDITGRLKTFSRKHNITLFTLLSAGIHVLLYKYTRQCDIITGTRSDGMLMPHKEDEPVNTLLIRTLLDKESSIHHLLKVQQRILQEAFEHRQYPFDELTGKLRDINASALNGIPEVAIVLHRNWQLPVASDNIDKHNGIHKPGICFSFIAADDLNLSIDYNADIYDSEIITRMAGHYLQVLTCMMEDDTTLIKDINYITPPEIKELLAFNNIHIDYPEHKTIIDLFEEQAKRVPNKTAVVFDGHSLTYKELDERSDQLANYLISKGIKKNTCVLLCFNNAMDKSLIGILGIMKAGGAYVPFDADLPKERITYLIQDTKAAVIVTNSLDAVFQESDNVYVLNLDEAAADWQTTQADKSYNRVTQEDLAYVIYTSGTTGDPKGVMIDHQHLMDYFWGLNTRIGIAENRSNALMSTLATDLGNTILFGSLIFGNTLHLFSKDTLRDVEYIHTYFNRHNIDCIKIVPTYWKALEYNNHFILPDKMIIFGGEQLSDNIVQKIRNIRPEIRIINHYGPTETTIGKLLYDVEQDIHKNVIPIGKPFSNTQVYIVDEELYLCPKGIWGELLIGGQGVFRGYLNKTALTAEKCIQNKFSLTNERLYRTGDIVRINASGEIEFGSRVDNQVKIQGYRIESGEIEAFIMKYPDVKQCFVSTVENENADKLLVAYIEVRESYKEEDLKTYLKLHLPTYMIPSILVQVSDIPMTSNGKVDKKKLAGLELLKAPAGYEAPHNEIQKVVVEILEKMFNRERISINDNFFELGGDSIKSIQVASRLRQQGYRLHLKDIIRNPVVKDFSAQVKVNAASGVKNNMFTGSIPLSPIQKYFFENKKGNYNHYNQSIILFAGEIKEIHIRNAFTELIRFHDTLRIRYKPGNDDIWQQYYDTPGDTYLFETVYYSDESALDEKIETLGKSLDIQQGPLIGLCLFKGPTQDILYIVIHHLLIDGVSFRILIEDLSNLYRKFLFNSGFELRNKSSSLKEWQTKLLEYSGKETLLAELPYWQQIDKIEADRIRPADITVKNRISERETFLLTLEESTTSDLLTKCYRRYNTEINEILITALCFSLQEIFNVKRTLINLEGHGREDIGLDADVSRTLGWFTTIFPVYFDLHATKGYVDTLLAVKNNLNEIPVKGIGYGVLKYLKEEKLNAQPEITFNYLGDFSSGLKNDNPDVHTFRDIRFCYQDASAQTTCNDILNFTGIIEYKKLSIYINFNKLLFSEEKISALGNAYSHHLLKIIDHIALS